MAMVAEGMEGEREPQAWNTPTECCPASCTQKAPWQQE